jgi:AcrR family transcriptional regulator
MRSGADTGRSIDDRTSKARIRDAAIRCIADHGVASTTVRKVAASAGVSPGLVIHHFGSMDGLRAACDGHVSAVIRQRKADALTAGPNVDVLAALRDGSLGPLLAYVARVLVDDAPAVARLVDDLVDDAEAYIEMGVESGMIKPSADPRSRAVILTIWNLGALALHHHVRRMTGVDLTAPTLGEEPAATSYVRPVFEIYADGFITDTFAARIREAVSPSGDRPSPERPTSEGSR